MEQILSEIRTTLGTAGISFNNQNIQDLVDYTNHIYDRGYRFSYVQVAEFLTTDRNKDLIEEIGLAETIKRMYHMKLPSITAKKTPGRNDPCHCGSGKKYKKCHLAQDSRVR